MKTDVLTYLKNIISASFNLCIHWRRLKRCQRQERNKTIDLVAWVMQQQVGVIPFTVAITEEPKQANCHRVLT